MLFVSNGAFASFCAMPGEDGSPTITGVVNTYYEATGSVSAGATTLTLGTSNGAGEAVAAGDLVLIIQNQDASINTSTTINYGDGSTGRGFTAVNSTGLYEFAAVASAAGASITFTSGLQNSYNLSPASLASGQKTYQVIKVPQYQDVTLSGTLTAPAWDGAKGGLFVIDVAGNITGGSASIELSELGFRGGAYLDNGVTTSAAQRVLYVAPAVTNAGPGGNRHAGKAEGIAGTPQFVFNGSAVVDTNGGSTADGYPGGDYARGAPGNAGGGGNDWSNGNDSGGGGGGNFGNGGNGGAGWNTDPVTENVGGLSGANFPSTLTRVVLGGGGGAGLANNANDPHGGNGGGIVILRTNTISGSFTINSNGGDGFAAPSNDGAGGAGAGGSVVVTTTSGLNGVTINAVGGTGGDAWPGTGSASQAHGPGGGGAGGYVIYSSGAGAPTIDVNAGNSGTTTSGGLTFGSTNGSTGSDTSENIQYPCAADLSVTKTDSSVNYTPGQTSSYVINVTNSGPADIVGASLSDSVRSGLTIGAVTCSIPAACTAINVVGQQIDITMNIANGQTIAVTVPVTYSVDATTY